MISSETQAGYDPTIGRWLSRDPMNNAELRQGTNLYSYVGNDPINRTDPLGLWYALIPGTWFDGRGYEGGGAEFFRGTDFDQGAYAGLDGLIPFWDPFAANGFYDPCDRTLQRSQAIGHLAFQVELTLAGGAAWNAFGKVVATEAGLSWESMGTVEQWVFTRGALHTFFWNSGVGGQAVAFGLTGAAGYGVYQTTRSTLNDVGTIFGP